MDAVVPPGGGPVSHLQSREEEGFYILEGEITFYAEGKTIRTTAGTFLNVPRDFYHHFRNESDSEARMLIIFAPAGIEGFFQAVAAPVADGSEAPPEISFEETARKVKSVGAEYGLQFEETD